MLSPFTLCNNDRIVMCYKTSTVYDFQRWPAQWLDWEEALKTATPAASTGQQNEPTFSPQCLPHITQPMLQKLKELAYKVLPHLPYSFDLLPTDYHFFKHLYNFSQGKRQPAGGVPKVCWIPKHGFSRYRNKLISHWQKCVDCNGFYFHE